MCDTESFIRTFLILDKDCNEYIERQELVDCCQKNNVDKKFVSNMLTKFDYDKDGRISLEEFCRGLGLNFNEMREIRNRLLKEHAEGKAALPEGIEVITTTMDSLRQLQVTTQFKNLVDACGDQVDLQKILPEYKDFLERTSCRVWQVVILNGSYAMSFCHEPFQSIQFKYGKYVCLAWRTPSS